jgi:hypothetical protein
MVEITEYREAVKYNDGIMTVQIRHPDFGWIKYTINQYDLDSTIDNEALLALIGDNYSLASGQLLHEWNMGIAITRCREFVMAMEGIRINLTDDKIEILDAYIMKTNDAIHSLDYQISDPFPPSGEPDFLIDHGINVKDF